MTPPRVEFLWWAQCPSWERALSELREEMSGLGLDPGSVRVLEVSSDAEAEDAEFVGSPTIRVNGADMAPPGEEPTGLTCRVYRLRDGRISALPDRADVRAALSAAMEGDER